MIQRALFNFYANVLLDMLSGETLTEAQYTSTQSR